MIITDGLHITSTSDNPTEELIAFGRKVGLKKEWIQHHRIIHFDITTNKMLKRILLAKDAELMTTRELIDLYRSRKVQHIPEEDGNEEKKQISGEGRE